MLSGDLLMRGFFMYCESCGAQNSDNSQFCESCGAPLGTPGSSVRTTTESPAEPSRSGMRYGKIGIIAGVLGIFLFFFLFIGLIAIVLGYLAYKNGDEKNGKIAMILGAVGTVLFFIVSVIFV